MPHTIPLPVGGADDRECRVWGLRLVRGVLSGHPSQPLPVICAGHRACTNPERAPAVEGGYDWGNVCRTETGGQGMVRQLGTIRSQLLIECDADHKDADHPSAQWE